MLLSEIVAKISKRCSKTKTDKRDANISIYAAKLKLAKQVLKRAKLVLIIKKKKLKDAKAKSGKTNVDISKRVT